MDKTNLIKLAMKNIKSKMTIFDLYQVTSVNEDAQTYSIKQLNFNKVYDDVEIIGFNLGHGKGQLQLLEENDIVVVMFMNDGYKPYILGSIFNTFMSEQDYRIPIKKQEYFVTNKANGSFLYITEDNSVRLLNNKGYGFEVDKDGNVLIRGLTITHTQTPRT